MKTYGYIRSLTADDEELQSQLNAMTDLGIAEKNIFVERVGMEQPELHKLLGQLHSGDLLYLNTLNALGNSRDDLAEQWWSITKKLRADVAIVDMPQVDTRRGKTQLGTLTADLVQSMLEYMVDSPRTYGYKYKQKEGIVRAKRSGRCGRPVKPRPEGLEEVCRLWQDKIITAQEAAQRIGCTRAVFYHHARELQGKL